MKQSSDKMKIAYRNRKGDTFYLHVGKTKAGRDKYYFSKKPEENVAYDFPQGHEIYENPNAQVFLRKITPRIVSREEENLVRAGVERYSSVKNFKIDVRKETIYIHIAGDSEAELTRDLGMPNLFKGNEALLQKMLHYTPVLLFKLVDEEKRLFITKRFCFRGAIDDWIEISGEDTLEKLVKKFVRHLGKESFYELI